LATTEEPLPVSVEKPIDDTLPTKGYENPFEADEPDDSLSSGDVAGDHVGATVTTEKMLMRQETEPSDVTDVSIEPPTSRQAVFDASAALGDKHCPQPFVDASCDEGVFSDSLGAEDSEGQLSVSPISGAFASGADGEDDVSEEFSRDHLHAGVEDSVLCGSCLTDMSTIAATAEAPLPILAGKIVECTVAHKDGVNPFEMTSEPERLGWPVPTLDGAGGHGITASDRVRTSDAFVEETQSPIERECEGSSQHVLPHGDDARGGAEDDREGATIPEEVQDDRRMRSEVLCEVRADWRRLQFVGEFRDDLEIVSDAVRQNGSALRFASRRLRGEREIVLAALEQNWASIAFADENLRHDREFLVRATQLNSVLSLFASEEHRADSGVLLEALRQDSHSVQRLRAQTAEKTAAVKSLKQKCSALHALHGQIVSGQKRLQNLVH